MLEEEELEEEVLEEEELEEEEPAPVSQKSSSTAVI